MFPAHSQPPEQFPCSQPHARGPTKYPRKVRPVEKSTGAVGKSYTAGAGKADAPGAGDRLHAASDAPNVWADRRRKSRRIAGRKRICRRIVHRIGAPSRKPVDHLSKAAPDVVEISFAGESPPRQPATNRGEQTANDGALPQALNGQRRPADSNQPSSCREWFGASIPPASIPHTRCRPMRRQVQICTLYVHAPSIMQVWGRFTSSLGC
jgi:hypothetical protein